MAAPLVVHRTLPVAQIAPVEIGLLMVLEIPYLPSAPAPGAAVEGEGLQLDHENHCYLLKGKDLRLLTLSANIVECRHKKIGQITVRFALNTWKIWLVLARKSKRAVIKEVLNSITGQFPRCLKKMKGLQRRVLIF